MHELPWIAIFGSRVRRFANNFHEWRSHEWKSLANRITSDPKIVIHGNECIILFLTRYLMSWTFNPAKTIGFRSRFSQCVDYMRFNEKSFCFRWQETTKLMLFFNTKTSSLVVLCDLRYLTGNISSVMTKHMGVQRRLHRFAYLIVQIILWFYS